MSQEGQAATVPEEEVEVELAEIAKACIAALTATSISKFIATPIERVKLILQTQDANPTIASGAVARYQGFGGTLARIASEQGVTSLWRGTLGSVVASLFSTHTFNRAFAGLFTSILPCFDRETQFWPFFGVSMLSGSLAGALSLLVVYPLDFARTRLCVNSKP
ncbi:mitochondrial carrier domain-containing protein [Baffinella frigidus]|nr:mitochondrial carrier domain-containing protein [Cryptophyta sp. CCMP2293]